MIAPRAAALATLAVVGAWVHKLGGVSASKDVAADGSISTDRLFNWHPVLMILAFGIFMSEAVLAYKVPLSASLSRPQRKKVHWISHSLAAVCAVLGLTAAWRSHTLKDPPIPNLYSPHSFLGLAVLLLGLAQFVVGFGSYLWPTTSLEQRQALGPYHRFWGLAVYAAGMAAAATGLQEKATFLQAFGKKGVYSSFLRLPAVAELLLLATVLLVLWQYAAPAASATKRQHVEYSTVQVDVHA